MPTTPRAGGPGSAALSIRELSGRVSNYRAGGSLAAYLEEHGVIGIEGIDTRALVRHTRERGAMKGILSTTDLDDASLIAKAQASPGLVGRDLAHEVMPKESSYVGARPGPLVSLAGDAQVDTGGRRPARRRQPARAGRTSSRSISG